MVSSVSAARWHCNDIRADQIKPYPDLSHIAQTEPEEEYAAKRAPAGERSCQAACPIVHLLALHHKNRQVASLLIRPICLVWLSEASRMCRVRLV